MNNYPTSQKIARQSGSNFYWSFFFLPKKKRNGILAIYAFSRLVDDAVDEAKTPEEARLQIELWRRRLACCLNGQMSQENSLFHPIVPELRETIRRFEVPPSYFLDLLAGVEMDLTQKRYETFAELETYCYHVAGTIGLLCNHLFGVVEERHRQYAILLGSAFQLTNILRDLGSDAKRGRLYLPLEDLKRFGLSEDDLLEKRGGASGPGASGPFLELMRFEAKRAERFFEKAVETLTPRERKKVLPAEMMAAIYHRLLQRLVKENFPVYEKKVSLSRCEKAGLVARTLVRSVFSA